MIVRRLPRHQIIAHRETDPVALRASSGEEHPPLAVVSDHAARGDVTVIPRAGKRAQRRPLILPIPKVRRSRMAHMLVEIVVLPPPLRTDGLRKLQIKGMPALAIVPEPVVPDPHSG